MQPKDALNQILSSRGQILDIGFPDTQEKVCQIKLILNNMRGLVTSSTLKNNEKDTDHGVLLNLILQHHFLDCHFKTIHADSRHRAFLLYWGNLNPAV
ncbi:hypothetical protein [Agriterribacter humi]|jgi:hypothetical protein|uniref:hypothetical protein n=1 Tax=Agriterribacter humi TaxID=1104781 RepID=UPI0012651F28|nr:hypothetical protein [Agriterribacter humi]